jgi:hypothetical protein
MKVKHVDESLPNAVLIMPTGVLFYFYQVGEWL